jgi:hypothetical protein
MELKGSDSRSHEGDVIETVRSYRSGRETELVPEGTIWPDPDMIWTNNDPEKEFGRTTRGDVIGMGAGLNKEAATTPSKSRCDIRQSGSIQFSD